jgi:hypothetical protein
MTKGVQVYSFSSHILNLIIRIITPEVLDNQSRFLEFALACLKVNGGTQSRRLSFIHDHVKPGAKAIALPTHYSILSNEQEVNSVVLDVFQVCKHRYLWMWVIMRITLYKLKGSVTVVDSDIRAFAGLYITIPVVGPVQLLTISGSLTGDGVEGTVNMLLVARGTASLFVRENSSGTHDLYLGLPLSIIFLGHVTTGKDAIDLGKLPYVLFFRNFYTSSADLASLDSKWVLISCSI